MKTIKYLLWLIVLALLGILIYQNLDYFLTGTALKFDLKVRDWNWTLPEIQNIAFFGICFFAGIFLAGIKGLVMRFKLNKQIKTNAAEVNSLEEQINKLKTKLEVFEHDPYIKKELEEKTAAENGIVEDLKPDTTD